MESSSDKLSPSEFPAQLTRQNRSPDQSPSSSLLPASHLAAEGDLADLDNFDFTDLDDANSTGNDAPSGLKMNAPHTADAAEEHEASDPAGAPGPIRPVRRPHSSGASLETPDFLQQDSGLRDLFDRVNSLLGGASEGEGPFRPRVPETLEQAALTEEEVERIVLKFLLARGSGTGRLICAQLKLPFQIVDPILKRLKQEQVLSFKGSAEMGDYDFAITDYGRERAQRYNAECTYYGAAPVGLRDYLNAMEAQSIARQEATEEDLKRAFSDLIIDEKMLERLGPAINSGRGMFLFGEPGNGKTSIAERMTRCFGSSIWIPRTLSIDGDIIRLYDPGVHELIEDEQDPASLFDLSGV
ncbi:MAG: AAA family ATPase, partial [Planctomycetaceae bacterium]|nr:AAA family ATPase [Planctomycetaceae bacterium]